MPAAKADVLSTYDPSQPRSETNFDPNVKVRLVDCRMDMFSHFLCEQLLVGKRGSLLGGLALACLGLSSLRRNGSFGW